MRDDSREAGVATTESTEERYAIDRRDLSDQIYQVMKREILSGRLVPGDRLSLEEFAQRFGVSVTPVRDALRLLAADGLVELLSRRGAFVTRPSWEDIEEVYQAREILECAAVDAVIQEGPSAIRELRDLVEAMAATNVGESHSDYPTYIRLDQRLHQSVVDCMGNRKLSEMYADLRGHTLVARALYNASDQRASTTLVEHRDIVNALERGDADVARDSIRVHLRNARAEILEQISAELAAEASGREER
ncbi:MAG: GntR family transcriptional regulator [Chloroflexota bacterium]